MNATYLTRLYDLYISLMCKFRSKKSNKLITLKYFLLGRFDLKGAYILEVTWMLFQFNISNGNMYIFHFSQMRKIRDLAPLIIGESIDGRDSSLTNLCK